jgi:ketopantoate reductase
MEILFVLDSMENIEHKISLLESFGADIKFFVHSKYVAQIIKNKFIVNRVVAIYNNNINATIDKYLKEQKYKPTDTLLCYSTANPTNEMINKIRDCLQLKPNIIYIKKKMNWWSRFKFYFYKKFIKFMFGFDDEYASVKLQYFSAELMEAFKQTNFKNHIFSIENSLNIEIADENTINYYSKPKFNKNCLYNPIIMCLVLICYVVLEKFLALQFWVYLFIIAMLLAVVVNWIVMIIKNTFDTRFKK